MLCLSTTTGYAIKAMACIEGPGGQPVLVREIAERTGIAKPYLAKIIHAISRRGLIETKRGYRGGVLLSRRPEEITLFEITEAVEGPDSLNRCLMGYAKCSDERACPSHEFWKPTRERIVGTLLNTSLKDVAGFELRAADKKRAASAVPVARKGRTATRRAAASKENQP